jgi:tetratricopeptide (TPR) repeat protein
MHLLTRSLLCAALLCATAPPAHAQSQPAKLTAADQKRLLQLVKLGEQAYEAGKLDEARASFEAALAIAPVGGVYYRLALCHERLEHHAEAAAAYRRYLELVPDAANRGRVEADIARHDAAVAQQQIATLSIATTPEGATAAIQGGADLGTTPLQAQLSPGAYTITFTHPTQRPHTEQVTLGAGETHNLSVSLIPRSVLSITSRPAGVEVREDGPQGRLLGTTPLQIEREPGPWRLRLSAPGYQPQQVEGELALGESAGVERALLPEQAPNAWAKPVGWGAVALGAAGAITSVILWRMASTAHDEALSAYDDPAQRRDGTYATKKADAESLATWTQVSAVIGGALVVGGVTVLLVATPDEAPAQTLRRPGATPSTTSVQLRWRF